MVFPIITIRCYISYTDDIPASSKHITIFVKQWHISVIKMIIRCKQYYSKSTMIWQQKFEFIKQFKTLFYLHVFAFLSGESVLLYKISSFRCSVLHIFVLQYSHILYDIINNIKGLPGMKPYLLILLKYQLQENCWITKFETKVDAKMTTDSLV